MDDILGCFNIDNFLRRYKALKIGLKQTILAIPQIHHIWLNDLSTGGSVHARPYP